MKNPILALLLLPALVPLLSAHPPFQDWPAHLAAAGALIHLDDPEAGIARFVEQQGWLGPNGALYLMLLALAKVLPLDVAAGVTLAAILGAIGPATLRLCRAAGADPRLALLALPVAFARPTYAGFLPNVAATAALLVTLAAYLDHRREGRRRDLVLQVGLQIALPFLHAFVALVSYGLILLWSLLDLRAARKTALGGALGVAAGVAVLISAFGGIGDGAGGMATAFWEADRGRVVSDLWSWLIGFRGGTVADDLLQIAWLAPMAALIAVRLDWNPVQRRLGLAVAVVLLAFVLVPMDLGPPLRWWGARGRLPAIASLLAIPLVVDRAAVLKLSAQVAAIAIAIYSLTEIAIWERTVMPGFDEAMAELPKGKALSLLWYDVDPERRFPGAPLGHAGGWYPFLRGGGSAQTFFEPKRAEAIASAALPFALVRPIPGPPWGIAERFDFATHSEGVEIFLVRTREDAPRAPFYGEQLRGWSMRCSRAWCAYVRSQIFYKESRKQGKRSDGTGSDSDLFP